MWWRKQPCPAERCGVGYGGTMWWRLSLSPGEARYSAGSGTARSALAYSATAYGRGSNQICLLAGASPRRTEGTVDMAATGDVWWAGSSWSSPPEIPTTFGYTGLVVSGTVLGPGAGTAALVLGSRRVELRLLGHYFLDRPRMPAGGSVFLSAPVVTLVGDITATTGGSTWFDDPSALCRLLQRQVLAPGGAIATASAKTTDLAGAIDTSALFDRQTMPATIPFTPLTFALDRTVDLIIDLELRFFLDLEGVSSIGFSRFVDSPPFVIGLPQWSIFAVS
jgi:hypothetical protein